MFHLPSHSYLLILTPRCQTKDHTKKKNLTIINLSVIEARNRIIVIVIMRAGLIIVTAIVPTIVTAIVPTIVIAETLIIVIAITRDMGMRCTQQATVAPMVEDMEGVVVMEEEVDMATEEVKE